MEKAKMVIVGVLIGIFIVQVVLTAIKKQNRLIIVVHGLVELIIASVLLTLDVISDDYGWIVWAIVVVVDVGLLIRKIMKVELAIQALKSVIDCQQKMVNFQHMVIEQQQLDLNNANKANTEHEH